MFYGVAVCMDYINKNRHYSLFLTSAYGAYVKRKIGDVIFSGYINGKSPKYVTLSY